MSDVPATTARFKLAVALVFGVSALLYLRVLHAPFVYDDIGQIYKNAALHDIWNLGAILHSGNRQIRIIPNLLFALDWSVSRGQTWSFHLTSLLLHLANGLLLLRYLGKVIPRRGWLALATVGLFLVHPLQIQAVDYVMGSISLIQCFFFLACLNLYAGAPGKLRDAMIVLGVIGAVLTKETGVLVPVALALHDMTWGGRDLKRLEYRKYALYAAGFLALVPTYAYLGTPYGNHVESHSVGFALYPPLEYFFAQMRYFVFYLYLVLSPPSSSLIHEYPRFDASVLGLGLVGLVLQFGAITCAYRARRTHPQVSFFVLLFFVMWLPTGFVLQMVNPFAEYRLYQPNISVYFLLSLGGAKALEMLRPKALRYLLAAAAFGYFLAFNFFLQGVWKTDLSLILYSLSEYPDSASLNQLLGGVYADRNQFKQAEQQFLRSKELLKDYKGPILVSPDQVLVTLYAKEGRFEAAWIKGDEIRRAQVAEGRPIAFDQYLFLLGLLIELRKKSDFDEVHAEAAWIHGAQGLPSWPAGR